jgi:hypothetical protein
VPKTWQREPTGTEALRGSCLERVPFVDERDGWVYGRGGDSGDHMMGRPSHMTSFVLKYVPQPGPAPVMGPHLSRLVN